MKKICFSCCFLLSAATLWAQQNASNPMPPIRTADMTPAANGNTVKNQQGPPVKIVGSTQTNNEQSKNSNSSMPVRSIDTKPALNMGKNNKTGAPPAQ